ncbi:hypothetical protein ILYODFUR_019491 [Ilyodon furcidens]|uniref:Uncharacterized protein n=1 Tax=Ilyodon furcidens TaxID=33524 RepID=A0ABV0U9N0_9TELE
MLTHTHTLPASIDQQYPSPGCFLQEYQSMASAFFCSTQHYLGLTPPDSSAASPPRQDFKRDAAPPGSEGFKRGRGSSTWESPPPPVRTSWGRSACLAHLQWLLQPVDAAQLFETQQFLRLVRLFQGETLLMTRLFS